MTLRSVPDGRAPVPLIWWMPVVTVLVLGLTTVAIQSSSALTLWSSVVASLIGYGAVWAVLRPRRLRFGPYPSWRAAAWTTRLDRSDPPTLLLPAVREPARSRFRSALLLLNSAAVAIGFSMLWSVLFTLAVRPKVRAIPIARSTSWGWVAAVLNAAVTAVLEECGMALLILAVAGLAGRYLPRSWDHRSSAIVAILSATLARTLLHIPLWGWGAIGRLLFSFALAWVFWRTRRIWPLIVAHLVWDTLVFQVGISPDPKLRGICALLILGWAITGIVVVIIALVRSRKQLRRAVG